jgi:hypothetical protein
MLTEEEQNRIRAEEVIRQEVRKSLEQDDSKRRKFWSLLNSAFVLWALSTIVVGVISVTYAKLQEQQAIVAKNAEMAEKIDTEMAARLHALRLRVAEDVRGIDPATRQRVTLDRAADLNSDVYFFLSETPREVDAYPLPNIYAEFENRTMLQLAYQYEQVVNEAERSEAEEALNNLQVLSDEVNKYYLRSHDMRQQFISYSEAYSFVKEVQQTLQSNSLPDEWTTPT